MFWISWEPQSNQQQIPSEPTAAVQPAGSGFDYDLSSPALTQYTDTDNTTAELTSFLSIASLSADDRILVDSSPEYLFEDTGSGIDIYLDNGEGGKGKNGAKTGQIDSRDDRIGRIESLAAPLDALTLFTDGGQSYYQLVFNDPNADDGTGTIGSITGLTAVNETLVAPLVTNDPDGDADFATANYAFQWYRGETEITGEVTEAYTLTGDDVGSTIKVAVTYTDAENWRKTLVSEPTAVITETLPPFIQTFTTGTDPLVGEDGRIDEFTLVNLTDAKFPKGKNPVFDSITNFNVSEDSINAPIDLILPDTAFNPSPPVALNGLSSNDFGAALTTTNFAANGAALLTFDDAGASTTRTFLAINDSTDGFDNRRDAVIELINPVGDLNRMEVV